MQQRVSHGLLWPDHLSRAAHFANARPPKVLLTTCYKPTKSMYTFLSEILVRPACYWVASACLQGSWDWKAGWGGIGHVACRARVWNTTHVAHL